MSGLGFLDPSQVRVVELPDGASAAVLGAPGSGKTTTIVELVADRILNRGFDPGSVLVLAASRAAATALRDRLALRVGVPTDGPLARTASSLAYEIVGVAARAAGHTPPRLVTGAEQDADIAALLDGHMLDGHMTDGHMTGHPLSGTAPAWPDPLTPEVRRTARFRSELRDLFARATERGIDPSRLRELGRQAARPEWVAAAQFFDEYLDVVGSARSEQRDPAEFGRLAVTLLDAGQARDGSCGERVDGLRLVVVDDLPEATSGALELLAALARRGIPIIAFGDPDTAANAFRGGEPDALGRLASVLDVAGLVTFVLETVHRSNTVLRAFTSAVTERIGTAAAGAQRRAVAERPPPGVGQSPRSSMPAFTQPVRARPALARIEAMTAARTAAVIARVLREEHLVHGVPWGRLAIIVRGGAMVPGLSRALALAEVPTRTGGGGVALKDDAAARALLTIVETGVGRRELDADLAAELLTGPFGGLDPIGLRRLRIALRTEEAASGGARHGAGRQSGELLVEALAAPGRFTTIDAPVARTAERLAGTLDALRKAGDTATAEELLWLAWERSRLASPWRAQALGSGLTAAEANRDLDGIVGLFAAAKRFAEHRTDNPAASVFFDQLRASEVSDDLIAPTRASDAVLVTTPSGVVGLEFDTVVVAGLQDGAWPNLRPRGSLLAPQALARADANETGPLDERRLVRDDELRMFALAISRARERVLLAAVVNDDESRSVLFDLLPPDVPVLAEGPPLTLRGTTGRLRRILTSRGVDARARAAAASSLARLAELGVPGASPAEWHGLLAPSTNEPLFADAPVPISPSRLERFEESPLDWFLETIGGSSSTTLMNVGTILHWAMETTESPEADAVWQRVEQRWGELVFESPWLAEHHRRAARVLCDGIAAYLADFDASGGVIVGAEKAFEFDVPLDAETPGRDHGARVRGSIDRVERVRDGSVVIVDLKTGSPQTNQSKIDATAQLGAYQLAYRQGLLDDALALHGEHRPGGAKLLYVKSGIGGKKYREGVQAPLDEAGLEAFRDRIRQVAIGMAAASFEGVLEVGGYGLGAVPELRLHRVGPVSAE